MRMRVAAAVALGVLVAARAMAAPSVTIGDVQGAPGGRATLVVGLETGTAEVAQLEHEVRFDARAAALALSGREADCWAAPVTGKRVDVVPFPDLAGFRAAVLPAASAGPIPPGPVYFCRLDIRPDAAEGEYPIANRSLTVRALDGSVIEWAEAQDGTLRVRRGNPVLLRGGDTVGVPGGLVEFAVFLESGGAAVDATRNILEIEAPGVSFRVAGGQADCRAHPLTGKVLSTFLQSDSRLVAEMLPLLGSAPIRDGELYRCLLTIMPGAPTGAYSVSISDAEAVDVEGRPIAAVQGVAGRLVVATSDCAGDCDLDGAVDISDLLRAIDVALGLRDVGECVLADADRNGRVRVAELVEAVRNGLAGCPQ